MHGLMREGWSGRPALYSTQVGLNVPKSVLVLFKDLLTREFQPIQRIVVETINDASALASPFAGALKQFGFRSARSALELWKEF